MGAAHTAGRAYSRLTATHPVPTNIATGGVLACAGDLICQHGLEGVSRVDTRRTAAMSAFGAVYCGWACPVLYSLYPRLLPAWFTSTPLRTGVGSSLIDNLAHVPLAYTPAFYLTYGLLTGLSVQESLDAMKQSYGTSLVACWGLWLPLQTVNFGFVPRPLQASFMNTGNLGWNVALSYIANNGSTDAVLPADAVIGVASRLDSSIAQQVFDRVDTDHSRTVSVSELLAAFEAAGRPLSPGELQAIIAQTAVGGREEFDLNEFGQMLEHPSMAVLLAAGSRPATAQYIAKKGRAKQAIQAAG